MHLIKKEKIREILEYRKKEERESEPVVKKIIENIRQDGDKKLIEYTKKSKICR
jgi:histidinol dehydrogenase